MLKHKRIDSPITMQTIATGKSPNGFTFVWHTVKLLDINGYAIARMFIDLSRMEVDYCPEGLTQTTLPL